MITLQNEYLTASISPLGAELQSLLHKTTGIQHLWSGDAAYWGKYSPVLFPIVGSLKDDRYYYEGKAYHLPRHGFAREKAFTVNQLSDTAAVFTLVSDAATEAVYPFAFELQLQYTLQAHTLTCTYKVYNPADSTLLFSVGAHPAFAVPFTNDTHYTDYYLSFNKSETLQRWKLNNGLIDAPVPLPLQHNQLPLAPALFYEDAIVLKNMQSNCITIDCNKNPHGLHFHFTDFPFFGIWAAKDAPFVCLEPWCGIADSVLHNQQLETKEGMNRLPGGGRWERSWAVECF
ncbi:MAG: aldose 1-epimerase family protein [Bacteroidetes bacterium]|nr:aldose 1-epimerase family protein [Bacteroidota bacterium]